MIIFSVLSSVVAIIALAACFVLYTKYRQVNANVVIVANEVISLSQGVQELGNNVNQAIELSKEEQEAYVEILMNIVRTNNLGISEDDTKINKSLRDKDGLYITDIERERNERQQHGNRS